MKVSVITVCYNAEATIEKTLISMKKLKAKCEEIEYLVIDGNSKDHTNDIIARYRDIIDQYVSEPDEGMYDALNKGIKRATGDWVMLVAADDQILIGSIDSFRKTVKADAEIWCGSIICKDEDEYYIEKSDDDLDQLRDNCVLRNPASLFKKSIFEKYGYYDTDFKCNGDGELFYRMYNRGVKFQIEDCPMVVFEIGGMSTFDATQYAIPERAMIYRKYELMAVDEIARWQERAIRRAKVKAAMKKSIMARVFKKKRSGLLTKSDLSRLGVKQ